MTQTHEARENGDAAVKSREMEWLCVKEMLGWRPATSL